MTAFNVVRFRVKPGEDERFIDYHRKQKPEMKGFLGGSIVKTGDRTYCFVAEWRTFQSIVNARTQMIGMLDGIRGLLEDLGGGLGVTDPVSGEVVLKLARPKSGKKAAKSKRAAGEKTGAGARKKKPAKKRSSW
jgi:hypothetical protein